MFKKSLIILVILSLALIVLNGCGSSNSTGDSATAGGSDAAPAVNAGSSSDKVYKIEKLLSAEEVSEIVGVPVTFDESALEVDSEYGTSNARYVYDTEYSTLHAFFRLTQDSAYKNPPNENSNAASKYEFDLGFIKNHSEPIEGLGDKAYLDTKNNQVGVLYKDCYVLVGFGAVKKDESAEVCKAIAKKIIENMY